MAMVTLIPETALTLPISIEIAALEVADNGYGGSIYTIGRWFRAQRSGYGRWCDIRIGRFNLWCDAHTGAVTHWYFTKAPLLVAA